MGINFLSRFFTASKVGRGHGNPTDMVLNEAYKDLSLMLIPKDGQAEVSSFGTMLKLATSTKQPDNWISCQPPAFRYVLT